MRKFGHVFVSTWSILSKAALACDHVTQPSRTQWRQNNARNGEQWSSSTLALTSYQRSPRRTPSCWVTLLSANCALDLPPSIPHRQSRGNQEHLKESLHINLQYTFIDYFRLINSFESALSLSQMVPGQLVPRWHAT